MDSVTFSHITRTEGSSGVFQLNVGESESISLSGATFVGCHSTTPDAPVELSLSALPSKIELKLLLFEGKEEDKNTLSGYIIHISSSVPHCFRSHSLKKLLSATSLEQLIQPSMKKNQISFG